MQHLISLLLISNRSHYIGQNLTDQNQALLLQSACVQETVKLSD